MAAVAVAAASLSGRSNAAAAVGNTVKSTEDMASFLLGYGIEANIATAQVTKVNIPKKFDEDFEAFNKVIIDSGYDLSKLKGKNVDKWVMEATNRTNGSEIAYAVLLVRDDKIVGAYLMYQPSGEVKSLKEVQGGTVADSSQETQTTQAQETQANIDEEQQTQDINAEVTGEILEDAYPTE